MRSRYSRTIVPSKQNTIPLFRRYGTFWTSCNDQATEGQFVSPKGQNCTWVNNEGQNDVAMDCVSFGEAQVSVEDCQNKHAVLCVWNNDSLTNCKYIMCSTDIV